MKAYGHSRRDKRECKYGCCTGDSGKKKNCREIVDRAKRKVARRVDTKELDLLPIRWYNGHIN